MSVKFTVITLDGKNLSRTRARAERMIAAGTHLQTGPRTIREVILAREAPATALDRVVHREAPIFDPNYFYPSCDPHPELLHLPFNYPLPYEMLRSYA